MNESGQKWARGGLIFGIATSVVGNIANVCLTDTSISLWLLVPFAVIWPFGMFFAIEVFVRNRSIRGLLARIGQGVLLTVSVPTAVTSFVNLHALMIKANEPGIAQLTGPLAIDGLMLGCTVMLLAARAVNREWQYTPSMPIDNESAFSLASVLPQPAEDLPIPISPAPLRTRKPRSQWDAAKVADMIADGESSQVIHDATGASVPSIDRMRRVYRILSTDPRATVDSSALKVSPERVALIREKVGR